MSLPCSVASGGTKLTLALSILHDLMRGCGCQSYTETNVLSME